MSSVSLTRPEASLVDFPPIQERRPGFWLVGIAAATAWFGVAMLIGGLPDIDDFERTNLLARVAAGVSGLLFLLVSRQKRAKC